MRLRSSVLAASVAAALLSVSACSSSLEAKGELDDSKLTIYSAQHKELTEEWARQFQDRSGVQVQIRYGNDASMGSQIVQEGSGSPADVFLTENSPAMTTVQNAGLLAPVNPTALEKVDDAYVPSSKQWVAVAARSTVLVYNPSLISEAELPTSLMDLAKPEYAGKWGAAAGGADFQAIVSAIVATQGEQKTAEWLAALKSGAKVYQNNIATMKAVNSGQSAMGVIYHYYWYRDQALEKVNSGDTKLHYFKNEDPGAFVSLSGAGVLKSSKKSQAAQDFLTYLTSPEGQGVLASTDAKEYAVGKGVASDSALPPLESLEAPKIDPFTLNGATVSELMTKAGLL